MALPQRQVVRKHAASAARRGFSIVKISAAGLVIALSYVSLTGAAVGPGAGALGSLGLPIPPVQHASISYHGSDPVITGSVSNLFQGASFSGPNRAEKTDRYKPEVDALTVARSFAEVRIRLAALRAKPNDPTDLAQSHFASADIPKPASSEDEPRISIASIDTGAIGALDAINTLAPQSDVPVPVPALASDQLAYARATAPVTGAFTSSDKVAVSDKELWCLSTAIYFEARGESYRGQVAVAQVVMNRTKHDLYPKTICGVVFQNQSRRNACQFSFACDGIPEVVTEKDAWIQAQEIAKKVTDGELYLPEVADATHYHATYVRPDWAHRMQKVTQVGMHVFYKFKNGWVFG